MSRRSIQLIQTLAMGLCIAALVSISPVGRHVPAFAAPSAWTGKTVDTLDASQKLVVGKGRGTFDVLGHVKDRSKGGFLGDPNAPTIKDVSTLTMTTSSGDKLVFKLSGTLTDSSPNHDRSRFTLRYKWTIVRGTGTYDGATGHGTITGYAVVNQQTAIGVEHRKWTGTVSFAP